MKILCILYKPLYFESNRVPAHQFVEKKDSRMNLWAAILDIKLIKKYFFNLLYVH